MLLNPYLVKSNAWLSCFLVKGRVQTQNVRQGPLEMNEMWAKPNKKCRSVYPIHPQVCGVTTTMCCSNISFQWVQTAVYRKDRGTKSLADRDSQRTDESLFPCMFQMPNITTLTLMNIEVLS